MSSKLMPMIIRQTELHAVTFSRQSETAYLRLDDLTATWPQGSGLSSATVQREGHRFSPEGS